MPDITLKELAALRELLSDLSPNLSLAISEQINRDIELGTPLIETVPIQEILARSDSVVGTVYSFSFPSLTENVLLFPEELGCIFVDLIEGKEGIDPPLLLSEEQIEKLSSALSNTLRGLSIALGTLTGELVEMESCTSHIGPITLPPVFALEGNAIQAIFSINIPDVKETELTLLFTPEMVQALTRDSEGGSPPPVGGSGLVGEDELAAMLNDIGGMSMAPSVPVQAPAHNGSNQSSFSSSHQENYLPRGMELIMDIPLDVTVELGRVRMLIKDVLELASGSIVELDRMAGEPVDLLVNGRLIAKGEVVVIEDNFGIRITEIISPTERVAGLGKGR